MFNFPFANDAPQYRNDTQRLFEEIRKGKFHAYTSEYVLGELRDTKDETKRNKMLNMVEEYGIDVLPASDDIKRLADVYVAAEVIPSRFSTDAIHIAAATFHGLDYIVSLNFQHIVKHKTIVETEYINIREGYKRIFIHTPAEVIDHDEND
jgi:predicted nucleic acid-binding protein